MVRSTLYANARTYIRDRSPVWFRRVVRTGISYFDRLRIWSVVLCQVRGATWRDEVKLLVSASCAPMTAARHPLTWQDPILLFDATVRITGIGRFHVRAHSDDLWHTVPWRERRVIDAIRRYLRAGDVFVDGGANIGFFSVLASGIVGPDGHVVAIEMMPDTATILGKHLEENRVDNVTIVPKALSRRSGETVTAQVREGHYGQASIALGGEIDYGHAVTVETATLSDILAPYPRIAFLKLDLEGAEVAALDGASGILDRVRVVVLERWDPHDGAGDLLQKNGFRMEPMDGRNWLAVRMAAEAR